MKDADDPQRWLEKARSDLLCIENNLNAERIPWDVVGFHAQQAAEKSLKALLVRSGQTIVRTHDLTFLLNQCRMIGATLDGMDDDCRQLTRYAVDSAIQGLSPTWMKRKVEPPRSPLEEFSTWCIQCSVHE